MKKILLILLTTLTCALHAEIGKDQMAQIVVGVSHPYTKALEICKENGFSHFIFQRISYSDDKGQTLVFKGVTNSHGGKLITETIELDLNAMGFPFGQQKIEFDILCFNEAPDDQLAVDVDGFYKFVEMFSQQDPVEAVEGSQVREMTSLQELETEIANSTGSVYLDCYSTSCPPCRMFGPKYEQYSIDLADKGTFLKINSDTVPEILAQYNITSVPTLIIFKDQKESQRISGLLELIKYFDQLKTQ